MNQTLRNTGRHILMLHWAINRSQLRDLNTALFRRHYRTIPSEFEMNTGPRNFLPDVAHPIDDYKKTGVSLNIAAAKYSPDLLAETSEGVLQRSAGNPDHPSVRLIHIQNHKECT